VPDAVLYLLLALLAAVWFGSIAGRALIDPDEGRYATLSLAMMRSGDWVTPRLNGLLYFEKPPMQYWIGAIFFHLFGVNAFAARLWPALASFLTVLMVGYTGARLWGRETGLRCLAVAAATTWIFANGHFLTLDAGLTLFLTLALGAVLIAHYAQPAPAPARRRAWIWLAWAALAGAVLSKGLVGLLIPGAVLVLGSAWRADWRLWRGMHWASGLAIFLLLAAPWFVRVSLRNPDFLQFFFVHEHFQRYLTTEHNRVGAWWYYLPLFVLGMLPWTSALPWLWPRGALAGRRGALAPADLLLVWSAFVLLFFSASGSKLPSYILPMFPALALLTGLALRSARTDVLRWHLGLPVLLWLLALAGSTQIGRLASRNIDLEELLPIGVGIRAGAAVFLMAAVFAWHFLGRRRVTAALLCVALGQTLAMAILLQSYETFSQGKSAADMVAALAPQVPPGTPVFAVRSYDQSLPFYLDQQVTLVDYEDEFAMGQRIEPDRYIHSLDDFVARWEALPQAAAYMEFPSFLELRQRGVPMRIVFQDRRRVMVVRR
jgi:4-amino-4-deoxy-L-arabinose transferase-like glycosyltransferase